MPENFKTEEDFAKSYKELQQKQSAATKPAADPAVTPPVDDKTPPVDPAIKAATDAGVDVNKLSDEYATNGNKLTDASYADLAKRGFGKEVVDQFIAGQTALQEAATTKMFAEAEVKDRAEYDQISAWAATNLTPVDLKAYNETVNGTDAAKTKQALLGLVAQYRAANGKEPNLVSGNGAAVGGDVYRSTAEMVEDMKNPKYKSDPAFQATVQAKLGRSKIF